MADKHWILDAEQTAVLRAWLLSRRRDIEADWEDLGELKPLLPLLGPVRILCELPKWP